MEEESEARKEPEGDVQGFQADQLLQAFQGVQAFRGFRRVRRVQADSTSRKILQWRRLPQLQRLRIRPDGRFCFRRECSSDG